MYIRDRKVTSLESCQISDNKLVLVSLFILQISNLLCLAQELLSLYSGSQQLTSQYSRPCITASPWYHHQMETFSMLLALVRGIHRSLVNSPHKGQWLRALMFSLTYAGINGWVNNHEAGDLRHHHTHYEVTVMTRLCFTMVKDVYNLYYAKWHCLQT